MRTVRIDPIADPRWELLLQRRPNSVFHSPEWHQTLADAYGFEPQAIVGLDDDGEPACGVSFCTLDDLRGRRAVCLPFCDYYDPLVSDEQSWKTLAAELAREGGPVTLRRLHCELPLANAQFQLVKRAKWHGVDLTRDFDEIAKSCNRSARNVRRAIRDGVVVRHAHGKSELRKFYDLHLQTRTQKYGLLAQPYEFFESIWDRLIANGKGGLLLATRADAVIEAVLFLVWQKTFYYKFSASSLSQLESRPMDLMLWKCLEHAKEIGCETVDLGLSDWDQEGLIRFKRKFASEEKTIEFLRYEPRAASSLQTAHAQGLLSQITDLLVQDSVPNAVQEQAGRILYRYFT